MRKLTPRQIKAAGSVLRDVVGDAAWDRFEERHWEFLAVHLQYESLPEPQAAVQPVDGDVVGGMQLAYSASYDGESGAHGRAMTAAYRVCMASRPDAAAIRAQAFAEAQSEMAAVMRECNYPLENVAGILDRVVKRLTPPQEPTLREKIKEILKQYPDRAPEIADKILALMEAKK